MSAYLTVKLIHIVSSTLLFGTGLGTAFFMYMAYRSGDRNALAVTSRNVVLADWFFTAPAIVVQLATGLWLVDYLQISSSSLWFTTVISMFVIIGLCWLPVVWLQVRVRRMCAEAREEPSSVQTLMRCWVALGIPAFLLTLALFALMVLKPGLI